MYHYCWNVRFWSKIHWYNWVRFFIFDQCVLNQNTSFYIFCTNGLKFREKLGTNLTLSDHELSITNLCTTRNCRGSCLRGFTKFGIKRVSVKLRQPTGQTQDNFNFGPSLWKFSIWTFTCQRVDFGTVKHLLGSELLLEDKITNLFSEYLNFNKLNRFLKYGSEEKGSWFYNCSNLLEV